MTERIQPKTERSQARLTLREMRTDDTGLLERLVSTEIPEQVKAEIYAIVAWFLERSVEGIAEWKGRFPDSMYTFKDTNFSDSDSSWSADGIGSDVFIEKIKNGTHNVAYMVDGAVRGLLSHVLDETVPGESLRKYRDGLFDRSNAAAMTVEERAMFRLYDLVSNSLDEWNENDFTSADDELDLYFFIMRGGNTAGPVMGSAIEAVPDMCMRDMGAVTSENLCAVREALFKIIAQFAGLHRNTLSQMDDAGYDFHDVQLWLNHIDLQVAENGSVVAKPDEALQTVLDGLQIPEGSMGQVGCPALFAKAEDSIFMKKIWQYASSLAEKYIDPIVLEKQSVDQVDGKFPVTQKAA